LSTQREIPARRVAARQRALLAWYLRHGRDLPWRRRVTPYGTWIAETMLQQTTVEAVRPRWEAFLARFPDVAALARAPESEVLAAWSGLGYYRRARHLHAAARQVMQQGGRLPDDHAGWRALPGVGDYAAGAIASIALGVPEPAIDANVRRVLLRWQCATPAEADALRPADVRRLAAAHLPPDRPGAWNQALMDLGAGPCRARGPDCGACPVRRWCAAGQAGTAAQVPPPAVRRAAVPVVTGALVLRHRGRVLLLPSVAQVVARVPALGRPHRDDLAGLFGGMLGLPATPWYPAPERLDVQALGAAWTAWLQQQGWSGAAVAHAGAHRHTITHHRLQVVVASAAWPASAPAPDLAAGQWWDPAHPGAPLSTLARRSLARADGADGAR
jgi:A/G-specific adenine glycosylase